MMMGPRGIAQSGGWMYALPEATRLRKPRSRSQGESRCITMTSPLHVPHRVPNLHWHDLATRYEHCRVNERALAVIARPSSGCLLIRQHDPATLA